MDGTIMVAISGGSSVSAVLAVLGLVWKISSKATTMQNGIDGCTKKIDNLQTSNSDLHKKINAIALDHEGRIGTLEGKVGD